MKPDFALRTFDPVLEPSIDGAWPVSHDFQIGDCARHPDFPGWLWQYVEPHNNPRVGQWQLVLKLKDAKWPRPYGVPEEGYICELGFSTLDHVNEMEVLALAAL